MRGNRILKTIDFYVGACVVGLLSLVGKKESLKPPDSFRRILVIKLAALGDTLLLIPSLRELRKRFPQAHIAFVGTTINEALIKLFPHCVDEFFLFSVGNVFKNPAYFFSFARSLRRGQFDVVFDFEQWSFISPLLCHFSQIPMKVGFRIHKPVRHRLYSHAVDRRRDVHEARNFLGMLSVLGLENLTPILELPVGEEHRKSVIGELQTLGWKNGQPLVVIHPGCGSHGFPREWPVPSYQYVCRKMKREFDPFFVFTGTQSERRLVDELRRSMTGSSMTVLDPDLERLIALVSNADLFISGNNGVMHLAAALQIPQIALHGPTDSAKWGPLNPHAIIIRTSCPECPCLDLGFEYHRKDGYCMAQISVDEVHAAASSVLPKRFALRN